MALTGEQKTHLIGVAEKALEVLGFTVVPRETVKGDCYSFVYLHMLINLEYFKKSSPTTKEQLKNFRNLMREEGISDEVMDDMCYHDVTRCATVFKSPGGNLKKTAMFFVVGLALGFYSVAIINSVPV